MQKLKVGDTVEVISGAEASGAAASKRGKVLTIDREGLRVRVEGLRMVKRHLRRTAQNPEGGIVEKAGTIALSNVMMVCPKCDKPTRVGIREDAGKRKRFCKKCDGFVD